ncbi:MAG TPA: cyanophycin synthetase, partial [Candidatus Saccharimonas sp.]|nr:cyanophycin synthetase [Candidatus Saccharimonas sp.]
LYRHGQTWLGSVTAGLYGRHSARIIAAAAGVGDLLGLDDDQLRTGLSAIQPAPGRMARLTGAEDSIIVDDSYNSSPGAAKAALAALAEAPTTGRRLAIMGSMNELGDDAPRYHAEVGAIAGQPETRLDLLVTVGALANDHLGPAAVAAGLPSAEWHQFTSPREAGAWLRSQLKTGDVVLVKGSQNRVFTEEAAKLLLANPQDASKLVRQTRAWLRRKAKQFPATPEPLGD